MHVSLEYYLHSKMTTTLRQISMATSSVLPYFYLPTLLWRHLCSAFLASAPYILGIANCSYHVLHPVVHGCRLIVTGVGYVIHAWRPLGSAIVVTIVYTRPLLLFTLKLWLCILLVASLHVLRLRLCQPPTFYKFSCFFFLSFFVLIFIWNWDILYMCIYTCV